MSVFDSSAGGSICRGFGLKSSMCSRTILASGPLDLEASTGSSTAQPRGLVEQMLDLEEIDGTTFAGRTLWSPPKCVVTFGGQLVAQAMMAAGRTLSAEHRDKMVNSVHAYFVRGGDLKRELTYKVSPVRDGRNYSLRSVSASQDGQVVFTCLVSFHRYADCLMQHQRPVPEDAPPPEDLYSIVFERNMLRHPPASSVGAQQGARDMLSAVLPPPLSAEDQVSQPYDHRSTCFCPRPGVEAYDNSKGEVTWLRIRQPLSARDQLLHQSFVAYLSDLGVSGAARRQNARGMSIPDWTSLDHSIWFHRPCQADTDWLQYIMSSPAGGGTRAMNTGSMYARDGRLIASVVQEASYRFSKL